MTLRRVGVLGCGLMGSGIAEVSARAGYDVLVLERDDTALEAGRTRLSDSLARALERDKVTQVEHDEALARISFTTELTRLDDRELIIEAVVEDLEVKTALFRALDQVCPEETLFASNTSSLPITEMAAAVHRSDRVVGLHFFNPVPVMALVEVVRTIATSDEAYGSVRTFAESLGKKAVTAPDRSGFLVNRLLVPFLLDAIRLVECGVGSVEDLDRSMVLGCGHPMGPLTLSDFVGNDTVQRIAEIMYDEYRDERYVAPPLLRRMVAMGRNGRKSGTGFYDYSGPEPIPVEP